MQQEITRRMPLLNARGELCQCGYARSLLPVYSRTAIRANGLRIKEWDYYLVTNGRFALALTIADNSYMGLDSISLLDFETGEQITRSPMRALSLGRTALPESSERGDAGISGRGYGIFFKNDGGGTRTLIAHMEKFGRGPIYARVELTEAPRESIVMATPFRKPGHFYYNQKINCMRARGEVHYDGRVYSFSPEDSFGTLDWGRGVWPYHENWYWGSASGLVAGEPFGFNIGYGFGDTSAATENALFYGGRLHKLGNVSFNIPEKKGKPQFLEPWTFSSDDGRFEMDFSPAMDRASRTSAGVLLSDQHQVFGRFTGRAVLDGGQTLELRDFFGFAEKVENKW